MNEVITKIRTELNLAFSQVFDVFSTREDKLYYKPINEGWSIYEVLEHVVLANYFLLRIINKQTERAIAVAGDNDFAKNINAYALDLNKLKRMELTGSHVWVPQRYTEPTGELPFLQLKMALHDQLNESIAILQNQYVLKAIFKTYDAGKLDALHYLYFLVQHMQRHLQQIQRAEKEFNQFQGQPIHTTVAISKEVSLN
jgi:hypothetical protein